MYIQALDKKEIRYLPDGRRNVTVRVPTLVWSDEDPKARHITKHYRGDRTGLIDIRSYADLQYYSSNVGGSVEGENPFFHIREDIDLAVVPFATPDYPLLTVPTPYTTYSGASFFYYMAASSGEEAIHIDIPARYLSFATKGKGKLRPIFRYSVAAPLISDGSYFYLYMKQFQYDLGVQLIYDMPEWPDNYQDKFFVLANVFRNSGEYATIMSTLRSKADQYDWFLSTKLANNGATVWRKTSYTSYYACGLSKDTFDPYSDYDLFVDKHRQPSGLYAHLCGEALRNTTVDSNMLANCLDLFDFASDIVSGKVIQDIITKRNLFERSSDAWLTYRYSYSTSKSDIGALAEYAEACNKTIARSGQRVQEGEMHVKIAISPPHSEIQRLVDRLTEYGVAPNLYNLWDLVPFSFIADWFIDLGDVLDDITAYGRLAAYHIHYVTYSWKWVEEFDRNGSHCKMTVYDRRVSPTAPPYVPYVESEVSGSTQIKRMIDTVALFGG